MIAETNIHPGMFMYPVFLTPGTGLERPIPSLEGLHHYSPDRLLREASRLLDKGLNKFLLFGTGESKSDDARSSWDQDSVVSQGIGLLKKEFGTAIYLATDVCLCAYTSHGHCGVLKNGSVENDESLVLLSKMALSHAQAGADMVAPSDMMDGRVGFLRETLDEAGFTDTALMAYSVKFASAYYGPFREAAGSAPQDGDRKSYQMDFRNRRESLREASLDEEQGADILMVKPALAYLDIISDVAASTNLPVACYNVSGEYAMVKAAAAAGLIDEEKMVIENMTAFARAGADLIISYHIKDMLDRNYLKA